VPRVSNAACGLEALVEALDAPADDNTERWVGTLTRAKASTPTLLWREVMGLCTHAKSETLLKQFMASRTY
jgi:hypothetical protein